ncbi:HAMP domain-containing sensor histidine kinase [Streptomyces sp. NPDC046862]|uniref:PAS domain-containing sensor histidine kinase n=1 Tax=Streptomyces sp. NPDC046862 TaxID=3154603 RepID=UPI0034525252
MIDTGRSRYEGRAMVPVADVPAAAPDGIVAIDDRGLIRYCNNAAADLFARPIQQLVGQPFGFPLVAGPPAEIELMQADGAAVAVDMRVTAATPGDMRLHIATLRDITRRQQIEDGLRAALEHQQIVVGVAAHELDSPLFAVRVLVNTLRDPGSRLTDEQRDEMIGRIGDSTAALQALLRKLLLAARIDARPAAAVHRVPLREFLLERLGEFGERSHEVRLRCPVGPAVLADRGDLSSMIDNYLENAFTHGRPPVEVAAADQDEWVDLRVSDHGPGVPEVFVPHLFQRFSRPPPSEGDGRGAGGSRGAGGAGLGLWIVAAFAEANHGRAWYEPQSGGGSCFCLRLPRSAL